MKKKRERRRVGFFFFFLLFKNRLTAVSPLSKHKSCLWLFFFFFNELLKNCGDAQENVVVSYVVQLCNFPTNIGATTSVAHGDGGRKFGLLLVALKGFFLSLI